MKAVCSVIAAVLYFLWPIDLLPDFIIGLGWADDIIAAIILVLWGFSDD